MTDAPRAFVLSEVTLPRFLVDVWSGHRPVVLAVEAILPPAQGLLGLVAAWALNGKRARRPGDLLPQLKFLDHYPTRVMLHNVFGELEPFHDSHFRYAEADHAIPADAFAYKQVTCNHVRWKHHTVVEAKAILAECPNVRLVGLSPDTAALLEAYAGRSPDDRVDVAWVPRRLINLLLGLGLGLYTVLWTLTRTRAAVKATKVFLAADCIADRRDVALYQELEEGGPILLVRRGPTHPIPTELAARYPVVGSRDGLLPWPETLALLPLLLRQAIRLFRFAGGVEPAHFYAIAALPFRRAILRAFFCRYHPRYFWGRDDYNIEHVIRREEIARVGGKSFGIIHGYPVYSNRFPMWRYISFDRYYVTGRAIYERYLKDRWAADMEVKAVGTFGAARAQYPLRLAERPNNIAVCAAVCIGEPGLIAFIRGLAEAFPDRTIWLQTKPYFADTDAGRLLLAEAGRGLANVVPTRDALLTLCGKARYFFSDPSTAVLEAIQFGCCAFNIDILAEQRVSILREFDGLCVHSAAEATCRIRGIESGEAPYRRDLYADLVDLSGRTFFDIVREDMGLAAREPAHPLPASYP